MQDLKDLIELLLREGNPEGFVAATFSSKSSKEFILYQGAVEGRYSDDRTAARHLYQSVPEDPRYTMLKARLEDKLLDHLLWMELGGGKPMADRQPLVRCRVQLGQARMLRGRDRLGIAEQLLSRALRTARAYEFTTLALACLEMLLELYAEQGNATRFESTRQLLLHFRNILAGEQRAGLLYQQAQLRLANPGQAEELLAFLTNAAHQLQELWHQTRSFDCYDRYYRLYLRQLELAEDYPQIRELASASEGLKVNAKRFDQRHNHCQWLYACLRTGQVAAGLQLVQISESLFNPASRQWLEYQENHLRLLLHRGSYGQAGEIIGHAERHPSFADTPSGVRQWWQLYQAYLHWMQADTRPLLDPRLARQLALSGRRVQPGHRVAILILEFGHHLKANQRDWLLNKSETYRKYPGRHLKGPEHERERLFLRLLQGVLRHDFRSEEVGKMAKPLLDQLRACVLPGGSCRSGVEIIPYEHLWERIQGLLSASGGSNAEQGRSGEAAGSAHNLVSVAARYNIPGERNR